MVRYYEVTQLTFRPKIKFNYYPKFSKMTPTKSSEMSYLLDFKELITTKLELNDLGIAKNFRPWKDELEFYLKIMTLSDAGVLKAITMTLTDLPREWLSYYVNEYRQIHPGETPTAATLIQAIEDLCYSDSQKAIAAQELYWKNYNAIQEVLQARTDLEGLADYIKMYSTARPLIDALTKEQLYIHIFARGLPSQLRAAVLREDVNDLQAAFRAARRSRDEWLQDHLNSESLMVAKKSNEVSKIYRPRVSCTYCGKAGHRVSKCRNKRLKTRSRTPHSLSKGYRNPKFHEPQS